MKAILILLTISLCYAFTLNSDCGDGTIYANEKQTQYDKRFDSYPKIDGVPTFMGGDKKLQSIVLDNLQLSDVAKTQIFRLNFQFTVTCEGKIKDVKQIGSPQADDWTNIVEIIEGTEGDWTPAEYKGKVVDCVYFTKVTVNGGNY